MAHPLETEARDGNLVFVRHGESSANAAGLFTGVLDVPLTARGEQEAREAARLLREGGLVPSLAFTSELSRSRETARIILSELSVSDGDRVPDWRLNERNYGALTGRSKAEVLRRYGPDRFTHWRRSVSGEPPPLSDEDFRSLAQSEPFRRLPPEALTRTESLRAVITRVGRFWRERLRPSLAEHPLVLVVAHGNSLRALCGVVDALSVAELKALNIPTGQPLVYRLGTDGRPAIRGGRYLDEPAALAAALEIAHTGGT
ncbi:2,3-diphosphoglycerate-dependent phosphoglycerate mutase [Microbacterium sp. STN6]|uniref:2,3-bisphosphoglycerate-dependent phosphoglycerate mutase n=1 Tax=Microbacterium sp. STN6 TaxID=2995588 RepID=UPI002260F355|nr:2,3-diphosphoglycerate-dependent phosphoglycerate mutase [Microbacterium sp. STN6]MCX7520865.1 2,3-diphosphoglycerate-dependent phosphoglycerate mutase [Microbacterium sp. STN6]